MMLYKLVRINTWLGNNLRSGIRILMKRRKIRKRRQTIQVLKKDFKLSKSAIKSACNSTWLQSDGFEVNKGKSQGIESVLVVQLREKNYFWILTKKLSDR